ncbi:MAG: zf-HC2 domain-containing protein [Acidobacteriota bacterium]
MSNKQKTPNCDMHEALVSYLYDEATAEQTRRVEAHLIECTACKQELHSFERVRGMLQQWQLDDLPVVRVVAERPSGERSMLGVLRELFTLTPVWAKALGAVAMAMLILAVLGTDVSVGSNGFSFHADLLRRDRTAQPINVAEGKSVETSNGSNIELVRTEVKLLVNHLIAESERQQKEEIKAQLVSLESQLQNMRSADLAKLATRIQEHQARLKTLERDIDRREGLDLTDILFSEVSKPTERPTTGGGD